MEIKGIALLIRKISVCIICIFILQSQAIAWCKSADQQKINSAIKVLRHYCYNKQADILTSRASHKKLTIAFTDLSKINPAYADACAVTLRNYKTGELFVYLNNSIEDAPVEEIACILVHESVHVEHCKENNLLEQEIEGNRLEVMLSFRILQDKPCLQYGTDKLTQKLNFLRGLYDIPIKAYIKVNPLYVDILQVKGQAKN